MERKIVIRKSSHFFEKYSRYLKIVGLALIVLSIPLTIYVLNQVQDIRQRASEAYRAPETDVAKILAMTSGCPRDFMAQNREPGLASADYRLAAECLNKAYCVVSGFTKGNCPDNAPASCETVVAPEGYLGGEILTSRKFAVAFIARYRANVIPAGDQRHWNMITTPTGTVFKDVPANLDLAKEIETAAANGFIGGANCGSFYTDQELSQLKASANDRCYDPEADWGFGFNAGYIDSNNSPKPTTPPMTRGAFLKLLYGYGVVAEHQDLQRCLVPPAAATAVPTAVPTAPPAVACNTACVVGSNTCAQATNGCTVCKPGTSVPQTDISKLTGCAVPNFTRQFIDIAGKTYQVPVECMNKSYCVTAGYDQDSCNKKPGTCLPFSAGQGFFGGDIMTSRKFAVAFIARYHVDVRGDWQWKTPTGTVFSDINPNNESLAREIETAAKYNFIIGNGGTFDPEADWIYGFHGVNRNDYFGADNITPKYPTASIKRGAFIQALYDYGTAVSNPELIKCMTSASTGGTCQKPAACNATCSNNADCSGAQDGCTVCTGATAAAGGTCQPTPPACGTSCTTDSNCSLAAGGCNTCNSTTGKCSVAACGVSCSRDSDCAGAATRDGCVSCLGGRCSQPFNPAACKCDGIETTAVATGQTVTFTAYSKVTGADTSSAKVDGVNFGVYRGPDAEHTGLPFTSGFLTPTVIENTATLVRYKTSWGYTVPADAANGDTFIVQADIKCLPKTGTVSYVPPVVQKSLVARIIDKVTEPIKVVLSVNTGPTQAPTPIPPKSLQIGSFYPGQVVTKECNRVVFVIKR